MKKFEIPYSLKNIPIPSRLQYKKQLVSKVQKFINNLRWSWFFINNPKPNDDKKTFGFKSDNSAPTNYKEFEQLRNFEDDLISLIENVAFKPVTDNFQQKLRNDCKIVKNSKDVIVNADKTSNLYEIPVTNYMQTLKNNVTKDYKKCDNSKIDQVNVEAAKIAVELNVADRIEVLAKPSCYITVKDHKDSFPGRVDCRLINPAKTKIGIISKNILDNINKTVRASTNSNQWRSTQDTLAWFNNLQNKSSLRFFQFDIESFYPSITDSLLKKSIDFASTYVSITEQDKHIIFHSRKTFLFLDSDPWIKKNGENFDVPMGGYDSAEVSDLVGLYLLNKIEKIIPQNQVGLYRDDGLAAVSASGPQMDRIRKEVTKTFLDESLKITVNMNIKTTNFLDVNLNLETEEYKPFRKDNNKPNYINIRSCHPPCIKRDLPCMVEKRLSNLSSNNHLFESEKNIYQEALETSGYKHKLRFQNNDSQQNTQHNRTRTRKVIWFNPPFNSAVATNIGKEFLRLVDKHFSNNRIFKKYFNRNTIKVSYSCMPNMASIISSHNKKVLGQTKNISEAGCNCRRGTVCPLDGKCQTESLIYQADVQTEQSTKKYIGMAATTFKLRYNNHNSTFNNLHLQNSTKLSSHIWQLRTDNLQYNVKWSILSVQPPFDPGSNKCQLCLMEKAAILYSNKESLLNKRHEIFSKCIHRKYHLLSKVKNVAVQN